MDLTSKRIIKNTLAKGTCYKVFCNGQFYGWLTRNSYKTLLKEEKESNLQSYLKNSHKVMINGEIY
jgi:hypothetical protein